MLTLELRRKPLMSRLGSLQTCVQTGQEDHTPGAPDVTRHTSRWGSMTFAGSFQPRTWGPASRTDTRPPLTRVGTRSPDGLSAYLRHLLRAEGERSHGGRQSHGHLQGGTVLPSHDSLFTESAFAMQRRSKQRPATSAGPQPTEIEVQLQVTIPAREACARHEVGGARAYSSGARIGSSAQCRC
jgi:hypothetical protein